MITTSRATSPHVPATAKQFLLALGALASLLTAQAPGYSAAKTITLPVWKPDPALVQQLAPSTGLFDYAFQPPQDYKFEQRDIPINNYPMHILVYEGEMRQQNFVPGLLIFTEYIPKAERRKATPEAAISMIVKSIRSGLRFLTPTWTHTLPQRGVIGGVQFWRIFWKNDAPTLGSVLHGFVYATVQGDHLIVLLGIDLEPWNKDTLPLLEASVLTFHKQ